MPEKSVLAICHDTGANRAHKDVALASGGRPRLDSSPLLLCITTGCILRAMEPPAVSKLASRSRLMPPTSAVPPFTAYLHTSINYAADKFDQHGQAAILYIVKPRLLHLLLLPICCALMYWRPPKHLQDLSEDPQEQPVESREYLETAQKHAKDTRQILESTQQALGVSQQALGRLHEGIQKEPTGKQHGRAQMGAHKTTRRARDRWLDPQGLKTHATTGRMAHFV